MPFYPKALQTKEHPQPLILSKFSPWTYSWVYQGVWGCITREKKKKKTKEDNEEKKMEIEKKKKERTKEVVK
jgi:hypothetical protein